MYCNSQRRWQTANIVGSHAKRRKDCSFALIFSSTVLHLPYLSLVSWRDRRGEFTRYSYPVSSLVAFSYKQSQTFFKKWPFPSHRKVRSLSVGSAVSPSSGKTPLQVWVSPMHKRRPHYTWCGLTSQPTDGRPQWAQGGKQRWEVLGKTWRANEIPRRCVM